MTNGINATQADIFLFLTKRNNWKTEAETNNDGEISQNEFCKYVNANWEDENMGCETPEHDLIIKFWNKFDTNNANNDTKYLFDKEEIANLETKLELYEIFDEYLNNIKTPTILSGNWQCVWLNSVKDDLSRLIEVYDGEPEGLKSFLDVYKNEILNKNTALCYAQLAMEKMSNLPEGYDPQYDNTLCMIIVNYASSLAGNGNDGTIKNEIDNIISAYAKTATQGGLSEPDKTLLGKYGYNFNQLNPLQVDKALYELRTNYNSNLYSDNEELFDEYFNAYIDNIEPNQYNSILSNIVSDFKKSEQGKTLEAIVKVLEACKNDAIKSTLAATFGQAGADAILNNLNDSDILNTIIEQIKNGTIDVNDQNFDLEGHIIEEIYKNFIDISDGTVDDIPAEMLINFVNTKLWTKYINDADLEETKDLAISYCKILETKGGEIGLLVYKHFGIDYEEKINAYTNKDDLRDDMDGLYKAINGYNETSNKFNSDPENTDFSWWCVGGTNTDQTNEVNWWNPGSNMVLNNKDEVDLEEIFYIGTTKNLVEKFANDIEYSYSMASGDKVGYVAGHTFRPSGETGRASIAVVAKIGNITISKSTMYFEVKAGSNDGTQGTEDPEGTNGTGGTNPTTVNINGIGATENDNTPDKIRVTEDNKTAIKLHMEKYETQWIDDIMADLRNQGFNVGEKTRDWLSKQFDLSFEDVFYNGGFKGDKCSFGWLTGEFCKGFNTTVRNGITNHLKSLGLLSDSTVEWSNKYNNEVFCYICNDSTAFLSVVNSYLYAMINHLKNKNNNDAIKTKLDSIKTTVSNYYTAIIDSSIDPTRNYDGDGDSEEGDSIYQGGDVFTDLGKTKTITYEDSEGNEITETVTVYQAARNSDGEETAKNHAAKSSTGIGVCRIFKSGDDDIYYALAANKMFEKIKSLYK